MRKGWIERGTLGLLLFFSAPVWSTGIISINLCSDLLLYDLADRDQIQSLSYFAKDRHYSPIVDKLDDIPINSGRIEQIIAARPSLVLASAYSSAMVLDMLKRFDIETYSLYSPQSLAQLYEAMRELGVKIGQSKKAEHRIAALQLALQNDELERDESTSLGAIYLSPNGYSEGRGTLTHELITLAGYTNLTADLGAWHTISLEQIIALKPDVIISAQGSEHYDRAHEWLSHPAIQAVPAHVIIPAAYWSCASSHLALAYQTLLERRTEILNNLSSAQEDES
ncbi:MAG: iron complex transport system substrate-binding protein [Saprospiraceae bacterium]|jgi:iron complex transport system substrate-binding protein